MRWGRLYPGSGRTLARRLPQSKLAPARVSPVDVVLVRPDRRRKAGAAELRIGIVVEVHGGIDQHPVPFAGAEQLGIAVTPAGRGVESGAEGRRHDHDVVLAGIDAMRDRPV